MHRDKVKFNTSFDINKVSFKNVSRDFETKFRNYYKKSLNMMSDNKDALTKASGASSLGILEAVAQRMDSYDKNSDFEKIYNDLQKEFEPFTET